MKIVGMCTQMYLCLNTILANLNFKFQLDSTRTDRYHQDEEETIFCRYWALFLLIVFCKPKCRKLTERKITLIYNTPNLNIPCIRSRQSASEQGSSSVFISSIGTTYPRQTCLILSDVSASEDATNDNAWLIKYMYAIDLWEINSKNNIYIP